MTWDEYKKSRAWWQRLLYPSDFFYTSRLTRPFRRCAHDWRISNVMTAPDLVSRGDLWRCQDCSKVRAV